MNTGEKDGEKDHPITVMYECQSGILTIWYCTAATPESTL